MDNLSLIYGTAQKEMIELIHLTAMFNRHTLTEAEKDRLDQLITEDDFNMRMFEILTDKTMKGSLQSIVDSLKDSELYTSKNKE